MHSNTVLIRNQSTWFLTSLIATALLLSATSAFADSDFCWKGSYGRGVGIMPTECPDSDKIGLLCYKKCPTNMIRYGVSCYSVCPSGMRDDGDYCALTDTSYGRGTGYAWRWGDNVDGSSQYNRCVADNPQGCEWGVGICYPKCKEGYHADSCCICGRNAPDCNALGLGILTAWSCRKIISSDIVPGSCPPSNPKKEYGFCYRDCASGHVEVASTCWGTPPKDWVDCGMGAAKNSDTCSNIVFKQATSVIQMFISVGMSAAKLATAGATVQSFSDTFLSTNSAYQNAKLAAKAVADVAGKTTNAINAIDSMINNTTKSDIPDIIRTEAKIAAILDPTGVAGVIAAYSYPVCSGSVVRSSETAFATSGGYYISANGSNVTADINAIGVSEKFSVLDVGSGKVALKASNGKYLSNNITGSYVSADKDTIGTTEKFTFEATPDDTRICIKTNNDRYLLAENGGGSKLTSGSTTCYRNGFFQKVTKIGFQTHSKKHYISISNDSDRTLDAKKEELKESETFHMIDIGNGKFVLKGGGLYLRPYYNGNSVSANDRTYYGNEFKITSGIYGGNSVCIQTADGYYLVAENGGGDSLKANRSTCSDWETFEMIVQ